MSVTTNNQLTAQILAEYLTRSDKDPVFKGGDKNLFIYQNAGNLLFRKPSDIDKKILGEIMNCLNTTIKKCDYINEYNYKNKNPTEYLDLNCKITNTKEDCSKFMKRNEKNEKNEIIPLPPGCVKLLCGDDNEFWCDEEICKNKPKSECINYKKNNKKCTSWDNIKNKCDNEGRKCYEPPPPCYSGDCNWGCDYNAVYNKCIRDNINENKLNLELFDNSKDCDCSITNTSYGSSISIIIIIIWVLFIIAFMWIIVYLFKTKQS